MTLVEAFCIAGAKVGLIDYGQSKQLSAATRLAFARLILEMSKGRKNCDSLVISKRLHQMGLEFDNDDNLNIQAMMAFGMFDTEKSHRFNSISRIQHFCIHFTWQLQPETVFAASCSISGPKQSDSWQHALSILLMWEELNARNSARQACSRKLKILSIAEWILSPLTAP